MSDPLKIKEETPDVNLDGVTENVVAKKHNSAAIFISIICLVIVLALLTPIFLGTNLFEKFFSSGNNEETTLKEQVVQTKNDKSSAAIENQVVDPLDSTQSVVSDIKADGPLGDEKNAINDEGNLLDNVKEGLAIESAQSTTKNSVTLQGDTLEAIEKKEADVHSDDPRLNVGRSVNKSQIDSNSKVDEAISLKREDNALYKEQFAKEDAQKEALEKARLKALEQQNLVLPVKDNTKEQVATVNTETKANKASSNVEKTNKSKTVKNTVKAHAVAGNRQELLNKNTRHYTLQVSAGTNQAKLEAVAKGVNGRYWIYQTIRDGRAWYVLIVGDYLSAKEAQKSTSNLPNQIKKAKPFAKSFAKVQQEMRLQREN